MLGTHYFSEFVHIIKEIPLIPDPVGLWRSVLEKACKSTQARAATFYLINHERQELSVIAAFGSDEERLKNTPFPMGKGICGWVAKYNEPVIVPYVQRDPRFNRAIDIVTGFQTQSIVCAPVESQSALYGVIEVLNRANSQFGLQDQEFIMLLGQQTAVAYQRLLLGQELRKSKILLESLLRNLSGGLVAMDTEQHVSVVNPAAGRLLGIDCAQTLGKKASAAFDKQPWVLTILKDTLSSKKTVSREEIAVALNPGEAPSKVGYSTMFISDDQQQPLGAGIIFQKIQ